MTHDQGRLLGNRYRLVAAVGRGGMGTVWRAYDEVLDREVAIKEVLLPPGLSATDRDILYQRTFREARASARLNHPGVVTVHDVLSEDDRPWIVMELIRARSLQDMIDEDGPVAPRIAADIGRQVLAALTHAHQAGILHRDVKPSNVLITDDGRAVLTDFGIAQVEGDATLTQTGLVMGSPAYIPPERVQGERAVPASDLWNLGATLYAAVEGKAPYERSDAMATLAAALTEKVPPPRNAGSLRRVLHGLLARSPAQRMTAETAMPLLIDVANSRPAAPLATEDATKPDQSAIRPEAASATVLDSAAIEAAARESATFREAPRHLAAFHQEPGPRPVDEQTEIQLDWQSPTHDPWRSSGSAHPQAYDQPAHDPQAYDPQAYDPQAYDPQAYDSQLYDSRTYRSAGRSGLAKTVVIVLIAAIVVAASLIVGALIIKNRLSASGPSQHGDVPAALALPAGEHVKAARP
jgi:serine/threonine protein kinase